jgi:hypothetical protein
MSCVSNSISRWESPICELRFKEISANFVDKIRFTFAQRESYSDKEKIVIEKTEKDCIIGENTITFSLSQEETLMLDPNEYLVIQIQIYDKNGIPYVSSKGTALVRDVINEGVSW